VISAYLERLGAALSFDPLLARCVRAEVEDHLREAVAADPMGDGLAAERRAIANFGDPNTTMMAMPARLVRCMSEIMAN